MGEVVYVLVWFAYGFGRAFGIFLYITEDMTTQSLLNIINQSYSRLLFISQAHARTPSHDVYICAVFNIKKNQIIPSSL